MIAVHLQAGAVSLRRLGTPRRKPGYALLQLLAGGICNTDIELLRGYYSFQGTPGHEFVARVLESDSPALLGRRVTGSINLGCGHCPWCARGLARHCPSRSVLGIVRHPGAFSQLFTLPDANLYPLPDSLPTDTAVFAEPVAAACEILEQIRLPKAATVAVLGDGKLGLLIAQVLAAAGASIHLYGRHPEKIKLVANSDIHPGNSNKIPAAAYDFVVEATGSAAGLKQAVQMTRPRGTIIMKSTVHGEVSLDMAPVIVHEISLIGSRCGRIEHALKLLKSGKVRVDHLIHGRYPLAEAPRAFAHAQSPGTLKILLQGEPSC